jgi:predicted outer membrane repeat protein
LHGGTLYATGSQLDFLNCTFQASGGGAIETYDCQVTLTGCTFQGNKGQDGGAIHSHADTAPASTTLSLSHCTFSANSASTCGGAIYNYGAQVTISDCTFSVNAASQDGGAIYNYRSSPSTTSCLFVGNTATGTGGAIQNVWNSSPDIHNCTFVGNGASAGGAVAAKGGSNPLISHCILWNNTATQAPSLYLGTYTWSPVQTSQATVEFCDVDGGRGSTYAEAGCTLTWDTAHNINRDPLFAGAANGDYHLSPDSPCINAGDPTYVPKSGQTDLGGTPRLMGSSVDLGAYEFQGLGPVYRFWSATEGRHFYTISSTERDQYLARPNDWQLECVAFYAFYVPAVANLKPVYRFVAPSVDSHFYTISEDDRQRVQRNWPDYWTYEGVAFYAYPAGQQPFGALPVYRFWSDYLGSHFYTIDENEKNRVIQNYPGIWQFEGIAWYAYAQPSLPGSASYNFTGGPQEALYSFTLSATVDGKDAQISTPTVKFATSSTSMQMALDFNKQTTTLGNLQVQTAATTSNATIQQTGSGVSIMIALSAQASFTVSKPQGPYSIDPTTGVFADYTKANQNILAQDPVFKYSGSIQFSGQNKDFNVQTTATQLELNASGTFENMDLLPDEIDAQMPSTFQWHRQGVKDLLVSASVNGHSVQLYVTSVDVSTQGVWKGKMAQ